MERLENITSDEARALFFRNLRSRCLGTFLSSASVGMLSGAAYNYSQRENQNATGWLVLGATFFLMVDATILMYQGIYKSFKEFIDDPNKYLSYYNKKLLEESSRSLEPDNVVPLR